MEKEILEALRTLLAPLIKETVLATIEEQQPKPQTEVLEDAQVTVDEAAKQLHVSRPTLWRWSRAGYLKPVKIGCKSYYRQSDLNAVKQGRARYEY